MSEPREVERRARGGVAPGWVLGALLLSFGVAFGVAFWIYERYVAFERRAAKHLVEGAELAVRADLEKVVLYAPFRDEVLPLVQEPTADPRLKPRLIRLSQHTGVELGVDVREVVYSRGARSGSWALAVGGMFPKSGVVRGLHELLLEEGHQPRFDADTERLYLSSGAVVQQAEDSVVVFASDQQALASALAPSQRYQALDLGLGEPALSVAFVDGAHVRLNAALDTGQPERLQLTLRGPAATGSVENTRTLVGLVTKVTGLPPDSVQFEVVGPSRWAAVVPVTNEHLRRAAEFWASSLRTVAFPEH
ncbi:MAG TPA: hypothetical protein VI197_28730 [Polyangiaceae bacterium]